MSENKAIEETIIENEKNISEEKTTIENEQNINLENELLIQKEKFLRIIAEYENKIKRTQLDALHVMHISISNLVKNLAPVIDDLLTTSNLLEGAQKESLDMIIKNMQKILKKNGIIEIDPKANEIFDPKFHQAIASEESDLEEGTIIKTVKIGYKFQEETIIPAFVITAK